jgi:hypothetical protein
MKIKVVSVEQVKGKVLRKGRHSDMIIITPKDGYKFIDNIPEKKHSNSFKSWYGYYNWNDVVGTEIRIKITDDWGNKQKKLSTEASYNISAKHPNVKMVR